MKYCDCHLHSSFSSDSTAPMEEMIKKGILLRLPAMCFTEHMDLDYPPGTYTFLADLPAYAKKFAEQKERFGKKIELLFGLEMGLQPHLREEIPALAASYDFDFLIGSTHVAKRLDPYTKEFYQNRTERESYLCYFEEVLENVTAYSCFDSCGHVDYVVRYGPNKNRDYSYEKYRDILDEILKKLIQKGIALECNTAGFKYGLGHPNPTEGVLKRYRELGGELLTLGSDAHAPEHLAYDFDRAGELLKACGFQYYTVFKKRKPVFYPL